MAGTIPERTRREAKEELQVSSWKPKTVLGKKVKAGEITDITQILRYGMKILESEIIDQLAPGMESDLIFIGQSKGKFGGGRRRAIKQTQKKTKQGSALHFTAFAVVGNGNGLVGMGSGSSRETVPARDKAMRAAKLNLIEISRGCGSWECTCGKPHTIPFEVTGREGSVRLKLMPAPKGTGLACESEIKKVLKLAGIKDIWSQVSGQSRRKQNLMHALGIAMRKLNKFRVKDEDEAKVVRGTIQG